MIEWIEDETGKTRADSGELLLSAEAWRRGYLYSVTTRSGELVSTGTAMSMRAAQSDAEDAARVRNSGTSLQAIAEQWVRGREVDLLGARVALAVENALECRSRQPDTRRVVQGP